ncbi:hypothetical protein ACFLW8_02415 [Chloroflexota bacterium]
MARRKRNYTSKLATKRGKYGRSRTKAFTVLASNDKDIWVTARVLCIYSGIGYRSLATALPRWYDFEYVDRRVALYTGNGDYEYKLLSRGTSWLKVAERNLPNFRTFISELEDWQSTLDEKSVLWFMSLGFLPFIAALDEAIAKAANPQSILP